MGGEGVGRGRLCREGGGKGDGGCGVVSMDAKGCTGGAWMGGGGERFVQYLMLAINNNIICGVGGGGNGSVPYLLLFLLAM